jgi:hypothetical protein
MNKRCEFKDGLGYRCGSYAFNLYKEKIEQGDSCDRHYWQERALSAAAEEREECAKLAEQWLGPIKDRELHIAAAIRARGTT